MRVHNVEDIADYVPDEDIWLFARLAGMICATRARLRGRTDLEALCQQFTDAWGGPVPPPRQ